jgi:hypothetical protein
MPPRPAVASAKVPRHMRCTRTVTGVVRSIAAVASTALVISACGSDSGGDRTRERQATPAPTQSVPMTCMPKPSACGFPDATNTGVPAGTPLERVDGSVTLSTPGEVYSGKEVHGEIHVLADNVTIEKVRVISSNYYPIDLNYGDAEPKGTVIRDVEIDMQGMDEGKGISFDNYTAQRVWFHNGLDCAHAGRNVVITDSFCDLPKLDPDSPAHADGFQSDGGGNFVFRHNTIRNPNSQTAAILMSTNTAPIADVVIDNNLMSGGGYTVYCGTSEGGVTTNLRYTNNVISREFFRRGGYWGPTTDCDDVAESHGNVWDGNYRPPTGSGGPGAPGARPAQLSHTRARALTRRALARALGRRYTRRAKGASIRCRRRSRTAMACAARWRNPRAAATTRRYAGKVVVTRPAPGAGRYRLRIRSRSSACGCSRMIKRAGRL